MSNNPDYDACIAAGNSPGVCAATFGPPEGDEGDDGARIVSGMRLQVGDDSWWKVIDIGGHQLRLAPIDMIVNPANRLQLAAIPNGAVFRTENQKEITVDNQGRILFSRTLRASEVGGDGGYAPQPYGSTQAGQTQSERAALERQAAGDLAAAERLEADLQAQEDEALRNRDFARAERIAGELAAATAAKLAAQNQLKLARLGEAGALARTFEDIKSRARDVIAGMMGENPFRGAVRAAGGVPRGVDPYEAFESELKGVANMPTPQFSSESDLGQLESAITAMQKTQMPTAQWPMGGRAGGGTVAPGEAVRVGELGEEIVVNEGGGRVKVIPIAENAAYGGTYNFDEESIGQVLGPMYSHLGFGGTPSLRYRGRGGLMMRRGEPGGMLANLQRLGIQPRLIRSTSERQLGTDPNQGIFWIDPQGIRHQMTQQQALKYGFDLEDITYMKPGEIGRFELGEAQTRAPSLVEPYEPYAPQAVPLRLPAELGGYALPDPRTIANLFRTFDPANREILIDALGLSEMGRGQIQSLFRAFTPAGTAGRVGFG